jgi:hypothetical protein
MPSPRSTEKTAEEVGDPETLTRIAQYELAFRMQVSATDAFDIAQEPAHVHKLYGTQPGKESFANNCLLARRLPSAGCGTSSSSTGAGTATAPAKSEALTTGSSTSASAVDRPLMALLTDLKQRGLLDDTLVVWSGEFGRTPMRENRGGVDMAFVGRDHNPGAFTLWMAGGGVKRGYTHGETDDFGYQA